MIAEAVECAHALPEKDPRHVPAALRRMLAGPAGVKIMSFGTKSAESLRAAVRALSTGVRGEPCAKDEVAECRNLYFDLLSAMKMLDATEEELAEVLAEARTLAGGAADWKDAKSIDVQLPNV